MGYFPTTVYAREARLTPSVCGPWSRSRETSSEAGVEVGRGRGVVVVGVAVVDAVVVSVVVIVVVVVAGVGVVLPDFVFLSVARYCVSVGSFISVVFGLFLECCSNFT